MDGRMSNFDDIFILFYENGNEVLHKIRQKKTNKKTVLEPILFMYLLTNTNIARIKKKKKT